MLGFFSRGRIASHSLRAKKTAKDCKWQFLGLQQLNKKSSKKNWWLSCPKSKNMLIFHGSLQGDLEISMEISTLGPQVNGTDGTWMQQRQGPRVGEDLGPGRFGDRIRPCSVSTSQPRLRFGLFAQVKKSGLLDVEIKHSKVEPFKACCWLKDQTKDLHSDTKTATRKPARKRFLQYKRNTKKTGDLPDSADFSQKSEFFMPDFRCKKKHPKHLTGATVPPQSASCCAFWLLCPTRREAKHRVSYTVSSAKKGSSWNKNHRKCGGREDHLQKLMKLIWGFPRMVVPNNHGFSY